MDTVDFDRPDLARAIEALTPEEIDNLPFGAVRLDDQGVVVFFSEAEARLSGFGSRRRLGRNFFTDIAPCMGSDAFRGRADRAQALGRLDIEFTHIGDFEDRDRELTVRIQSASDGGIWIFLRRESGSSAKPAASSAAQPFTA